MIVRPCSSINEWPEFGPPQRTQISIFCCFVIKAEIFPFPSDPYCPPTTTQRLIRDLPSESAELLHPRRHRDVAASRCSLQQTPRSLGAIRSAVQRGASRRPRTCQDSCTCCGPSNVPNDLSRGYLYTTDGMKTGRSS